MLTIYLHNVYWDTDDGEYHSYAQTRGELAHSGIDTGFAKHKRNEIFGMSVCSSKYSIYGKIDVYKEDDKLLIERKYELKTIYRGQIYQLWGQYFCMKEMGYPVTKLGFYEISTRKTTYIDIPGEKEIQEFEAFLNQFRSYNPENQFEQNANKCKHCIYSNLCDKTTEDNVYQ